MPCIRDSLTIHVGLTRQARAAAKSAASSSTSTSSKTRAARPPQRAKPGPDRQAQPMAIQRRVQPAATARLPSRPTCWPYAPVHRGPSQPPPPDPQPARPAPLVPRPPVAACLESIPMLLSDLVRFHLGRPAALPTATGWDEELRARTAGVRLVVVDYRGRGTPSHRLGRIHPYVRSCSATGINRERSDWRQSGGPESVQNG